MSKNKAIATVIGVLVVIVIILYGVFSLGKSKIATTEKVATVNGVEITKIAYDAQVSSLTVALQSQGVDVTSATKQAEINKQALDNLINNELVTQGVKSSGIKVTDAEVEAQFQTIVTQNGGQDGFTAALVKANMTEVQLKTNIANQLAIEKYLLTNVNINGITVTDTEVSDFYTQYSKANGTSTPPLKDISAQIKQQITVNKQQILVNDFIASLKAKATIVTNI